jgi:uncharacterized protein YigA (DUF484 family)
MTDILSGEGLNLEGGADWAAARSLIMLRPELVRDDPCLLQALGLRPHAANVVEFGPAALARLEAARDRESTAREQIEDIARANFSAQAEVHALVLELLESRNSADLAWRLNAGAQRRFALECAAVGVEGTAPNGWRALPTGLVGYILEPGRLCGVGPCTGGHEIFGDAADRVRSVALVRMSLFESHRPGLVAFGSADPEGFTPDMGVELIAFLGQVVERLGGRWLSGH